MAKTVNEMLIDTLTTKKEKTPRYKELLEDMGYTLTADEYDAFWNVNGIGFYRGRGFECRLYNANPAKPHRIIKGKENLAKVDWKNLLAVKDKRRAKNEAWFEQGNYRVQPRRVHYWNRNSEGYVTDIYYAYDYDCVNHVIEHYHQLKRAASEEGIWGYDDTTEVEYAESWLESAKRELVEAEEAVVKAKKEVAERERKLAEEIEKAAAGKAKLNAFLADHGVKVA